MKNLKSMKTIKILAILFIATHTFTACSSDNHDDDHDHEEELITTVTYTLTNGTDIVTMIYTDPDGEGGLAGTYDISGPLTASTTYTGVVKLENATESPAEDITEEVKTEGVEHEFFYNSTVGRINKTDVDENNNSLGIETELTTGVAGTGMLTIILRHEPKKPNTGLTDAGGSTDVEVTFTNITVQ